MIKVVEAFELKFFDLEHIEDPFFGEGLLKEYLKKNPYYKGGYTTEYYLERYRSGRIFVVVSRPRKPMLRYDYANKRWIVLTSYMSPSLDFNIRSIIQSVKPPARIEPRGEAVVKANPEPQSIPKPISNKRVEKKVLKEEPKKIKLIAHYKDKWKTPMAGATFNLYINDAKVLSEAKLKGYKPDFKEAGTYIYEYAEDGKINFEIVTEDREAQLRKLKEDLINLLDPDFKELNKSMVKYQEEWRNNSAIVSLSNAVSKGAKEALKDVGESIEEMFTAKFWSDIGDDIVTLKDSAKRSIGEGLESLDKAYEEVSKEIEQKGFYEWAGDEVNEMEDGIESSYEELKVTAKTIASTADLWVKDGKIIYDHREEIMALPKNLLGGEVNKVEMFLDKVVLEIDKELYDELKNSEHWQSTIELLYDREAINVPVIYLQAMLRAVPPNFYMQQFGYIAVTLIVEIILVIILALLGGVGAIARLVSLVNRLKKAISVADKAGTAFISLLEKFQKAIELIKDNAMLLTVTRRIENKLGATTQKRVTLKRNQDNDNNQNKNRKDCEQEKKKNRPNKKLKKGNVNYG